MSEHTRLVRLHVQNRLEELNSKYGLVDDVMPPWLDHYPSPDEFRQWRGLDQPAAPLQAATVQGPTSPVVEPSPVAPIVDVSDLDV